MTPQQLMDLPYAGMAEKQLRKQGDWDDPVEYMLKNDIQDALSAIERAHINSMKLKEATA